MTAAQATAELAFALSTRAMDKAIAALDRGANPDVRIPQNKGLPDLCALEWAIQGFFPLPVLRALVRAGARLSHNGAVKQACSLLGVALRHGNMSAAIMLMEHVAPVDEDWLSARQSANPVMAAQLLLNAGSAGSRPLDANHPAVALCAGVHAMKMVSMLHGRGMQWAGMVMNAKFIGSMSARMDVYLEVLQLAHRQGAPALAKAVRKSGSTPLHRAPAQADFNQLLASPVSAQWKEARDRSGRTPLAAQLHQGNLQAVQALLAAGCVPPPIQASEDRQGYALRLLSSRHRHLESHDLLDQLWAAAQQQSLEAEVARPAPARPRGRL